MNIVPSAIIMVISLTVMFLWFLEKRQPVHAPQGTSSFPAVLLSFWVVAAAVFGPNFFILRFAGVFDITIERMLFMMVLAWVTVGLFTGKVNIVTHNSIEIAMFGFATICVISMMRVGFVSVDPARFPSPWFVFITGYFFPFVVYVYAKSFIQTEEQVYLVLTALFIFGIYLCLIAPLEYFKLRQYVYPQYINDPKISTLHLERARGPFLNAAFNGVAIVIGFISGMHLLPKKTGFSLAFSQGMLLLFPPAVFFTLTRSVYLGFLISLFIFFMWYKTPFSKWKLISIPVAIAVAVIFINAHRLASSDRREGGVYQVEEVEIRMALLGMSYYLFTQHPVLGIGLAQFIPVATLSYTGKVPYVVEVSTPQFQHNHLMGIATELGLVGLVAYVIMVVLILRRFMQTLKVLPEEGFLGKNFCIVVIAVWCVYLNNNLFVEPSNALFINSVPFLFAGLTDGLYVRATETSTASHRNSRTLPRYV